MVGGQFNLVARGLECIVGHTRHGDAVQRTVPNRDVDRNAEICLCVDVGGDEHVIIVGCIVGREGG